MAHLNPDSPFQSWILTAEEFQVGSCLTITQKQCIQNQICSLAVQKNNLEPDYSNPILSAQREAHLRGQIDALTHLLTISASSEAQMSPGAQSPQTPEQSSLFPQE